MIVVHQVKANQEVVVESFYDQTGKYTYIITNHHVIDGANKSTGCIFKW